MAVGGQCGRAALRVVTRPLRTARSAPPCSAWDVALATAGEPGRTARREVGVAAAEAAATLQTAPPAAKKRERGQQEEGGTGRGVLELARERNYGSFCRST